jgi:hypothetical protein
MSRIAKVGAVALGTGAMVLSGAGLAVADASGKAAAVGSPGLASGNVFNTVIHLPVQLCTAPIEGVGVLSKTFGTVVCKNDSDKKHDKNAEKKNAEKKSSKKAGHHGH